MKDDARNHEREDSYVYISWTYLLTYSIEQSPSWEADSKLCS
jgi:hypothetical protein